MRTALTLLLSIIVQDPKGTERMLQPVVITGDRILETAATHEISVGALRLKSGGKDIAFQVDEKDGTGLYQQKGNGRLDADDELVLLVSLKPKQRRTFRLYLATEKNEPPKFESGLEFRPIELTEISRLPYNAMLRNGCLSMGLRAGGPSTKRYGMKGNGAITDLRVRGASLVRIGWSHGNMALRSALTGCNWGLPRLLAEGPVRAIVMIAAENVGESERASKWARKNIPGSVYQYFILYDGIPYLEVQQKFVLSPLPAPLPITYQSYVHPSGGQRDWVNERLLSPQAGGVKLGTYKDGAHYVAERPEEAWVALHNPILGLGIATFFPRTAASVRAGLYSRRLNLDKIFSSVWNTMAAGTYTEVSLKLEPRDGRVEQSFGIFGLGSEGPAQVREHYLAFWQSPLGPEAQILRAR